MNNSSQIKFYCSYTDACEKFLGGTNTHSET